MAVVALTAAACGSSSNTAATTSTTAGGAGTPPASTTVRTASTKLGTILVNSAGMTLYTLINTGHPVSCTGACAGVWPPAVLPAGQATPTGGQGVSGLGTISVNGVKLVTHLGLPLYTYVGDTAAGEVKGDGLNTFGGIWHVVKTGVSAGAGGATTPTGTHNGY
jgi:predicted lipoprotein with Yx(FWY)xxD motif